MFESPHLYTYIYIFTLYVLYMTMTHEEKWLRVVLLCYAVC